MVLLRRLPTISRYLAREFLMSFSIAFFFFFIVFFVNVLLVMAEDIFSKQVPLPDVLRLVVYSFPLIIAYCFPFGTLLGGLMALGRLAADNELIAIMAAGIRSTRIFYPLLLFGGIFSIVSFVTNDFLLPASTIEFSKVYRRIIYSNPAVELEPLTVKRYEGTSIITGGMDGNVLLNVMIIDRADGDRRVITAARAQLVEPEGHAGVVTLMLEDVFTEVAGADDPSHFEFIHAEQMEYNLLLRDISVSLSALGPREMSSLDVWREIVRKRVILQKAQREKDDAVRSGRYDLLMQIQASAEEAARSPSAVPIERDRLAGLEAQLLRSAADQPRDSELEGFRYEFHKKFSTPLSCLVFAFFAFPAGLLAKRSGRAFGFLVGIVVSFGYWILIFLGQTSGMRYGLDPAFTMWVPNVAVLLAGGLLLVTRRAQ